jgi:ABC-type nitrate/sulfonate/bicarbonate transport system permease component
VNQPEELAEMRTPILDRAIRPLASVVQVTPVVALAPLVLIWAGLDHPHNALIILAVLVALPPCASLASPVEERGLKSADRKRPDGRKMRQLRQPYREVVDS